MTCFHQEIFQFVIIIGFIGIDITPFWKIELEDFEHTYITVRAWCQNTCTWLTVWRDQLMHFEPIKIALLAGNIATIFFLLIQLRPRHTIVITGGDRKTINDIYRFTVELVPYRPS